MCNLANSYLVVNDEYPHSETVAHKLLLGGEGGTCVAQGPSNDGIAYTTVGEDREEEVLDEEGNVLLQDNGKVLQGNCGNVIKCYLCGGNHYWSTCDKKEESGDEKRKKQAICISPPIVTYKAMMMVVSTKRWEIEEW
eukprot:15277567-Ditylum_brightwellii.AAC.1